MQHDLCWLLRNKQWVIQREACLEMARVYLVAMLSLDLPLHSFRPFLLLELFHFDGDDDKRMVMTTKWMVMMTKWMVIGDSHPDENDERDGAFR